METSLFSQNFLFGLFLVYNLITQCALELQLATSPDANLVLTDAMYFEIVEPEELGYTFKLKPARDFGGLFERSLSKVEMRFVEPIEGCSTLTTDLTGSIAFIMRGGCSFLSKTYNAEKANAIGVIITDNDLENDDKFVDMIDDNTSRTVSIPAMFLMGKDGAMIRRTLEKLSMHSALINIPVNLTGVPITNINQPPWTLW